MKTVIYANVDGYDIVLGFGEAQIDPMATSAKIAETLKASEEAQALEAVNTKLDALARKMSLAASDALRSSIMAQVGEITQEFPALSAAIAARRAQLMAENAVYFTPGPGENLCTEEQMAAYEAVQGGRVKVRLDGKPIADYRGTSWWSKSGAVWSNGLITCLGIEPSAGAVLEASLSDTQKAEIIVQIEAERVAALTGAERLSEAQAAAAQAKTAAAQTQAEEQIAGANADAAMTSAQEQYQAAIAAINAKYGTDL